MQNPPYDPAFARQQQQQHQMQVNQQQAQLNRHQAAGNVRLRQDFTNYKNSFTNVVKQMAADLLSSAEAMNSGSANDETKRGQHPSTEALLNEFDTAYTQLEYNLSFMHRSYLRQQQVLQQNQSIALLTQQAQQQPGGDANAASVKGIVDRLSELLKPPVHLKSASTVESLQQQKQQLQAAMENKDRNNGLLNPASNESSDHSSSHLMAAPNSLPLHQQGPSSVGSHGRIPSKSQSKTSSKSSSAASSSRASPTDPIGLNPQSLMTQVENVQSEMQTVFSMDVQMGSQQSATSSMIQSQQPVQQQQARKHLIDLGYGNSDSDSDENRSNNNSPDSNADSSKLLASAMDVDNPRDAIQNIVDDASLSLPVPDESHIESKPILGESGTNEDSIGFGAMFGAQSSGPVQVKVESTIPYEGDEQGKSADIDRTPHLFPSHDEESLLSPAGVGETKPAMFMPHSHDANEGEHFGD